MRSATREISKHPWRSQKLLKVLFKEVIVSEYHIINSIQLREEINLRRAHTPQLQEKLRSFWDGEGVDPEVVNHHFPQTTKQVVEAVLMLPTPSIRLKEISVFVCARQLKLEPVGLGFFRDAFCSVNHDKTSCVKIPWLKKGRKGLFVEYENIVDRDERECLDRRILSSIRVNQTFTLPEFHENLRARVFGRAYPVTDISTFLRNALKSAFLKQLFPHHLNVFLKKGDKEVPTSSIKLKEISFEEVDLRPPLGWFYPLFLSLFVDGSRVLFETFETDESIASIEEVKRQVGFYPLVVRVPSEAHCNGFNSNLLECPRDFLKEEKPRLLERLEAKISSSKEGEDIDIERLMVQIAEQALALL